MPQMAPMNWLTLFFYFTFTFMIFNSMNYFSFFYSPKSYKLTFKSSLLNWKW